MTIINSNINSGKFKHLTSKQIEYVISALIAFESEHKGIKRNIGKTEFVRALAKDIGACAATVYNLVKDARIVIRNSDLTYKQELSSSAATCLRENNRSMSKKNIKVDVASDFIKLVVDKLKSNKYASIDETIHSLKLHNTEAIKDMITVSTKTFYSYVHRGLVEIKPIDLPRMLRRRKRSYKTYIGKLQKGTCITERPFAMDDRSEFGHWEGDLVVGPRDGKKGALLTLIERKTRFYFTIRVKSKKSKYILRAFNKLHKLFGSQFSQIFKTITFDNGSEFARYKEIEIKPGTKKPRTKVYFARPYRSSDRGSNENCNGLVRYTIIKGSDIDKVKRETIVKMNMDINEKPRKINGYISSHDLFLVEISNIVDKEFDLYSVI